MQNTWGCDKWGTSGEVSHVARAVVTERDRGARSLEVLPQLVVRLILHGRLPHLREREGETRGE